MAELDDHRGLGCALAFGQDPGDNADATSPAARVVAGLGCIVMLVMFGWLARSLPRNLWAPILRQREFRSLKIYLGLGVVVLGVLGAFALGAPVSFWVLLGTLLITVVVSWVAPRFDKIDESAT